MDKKFLSAKEIEATFNIDAGTLANWRSGKRGPRFVKIGKKVVYRTSDLEAFLARHTVLTIDDR